MDLETKLFGIVFIFMLLACITFVAFGQVTVRKLRKNPESRDSLGSEFASGWDILNVAGALCRPKWLSARLRRSSLSFLAADANVIHQHTNKLDRCLGRVFFFSYVATASLGILFTLASYFGAFD